jgi:hypothetical protein
MAVAIITTGFPEGIGTDVYDRVNAEIGMDNPPEGLIFHWSGHVDGEWTITDVWESREANDAFRSDRLFPAIQKVTGMNPEEGPQPTVTEHPVHNFVKP